MGHLGHKPLPAHPRRGTPMSSERYTAAYARPGDTVRFECEDCEAIYSQTVQPRRNVERALRRIDEGDLDRARELLTDALADLQDIAAFMSDRRGP
jgi:hypothetical protein